MTNVDIYEFWCGGMSSCKANFIPSCNLDFFEHQYHLGVARETMDHVLLHCPSFDTLREETL